MYVVTSVLDANVRVYNHQCAGPVQRLRVLTTSSSSRRHKLYLVHLRAIITQKQNEVVSGRQSRRWHGTLETCSV